MNITTTHHPIKTALLAYGMSGKVFHAPFLHVHPGFDLVAVFERTKNLAVQDYPQLHTYRSVETLLLNPEIELVVVNTPNFLHYDHCKAALFAGKHILVEKPFTATVEQAKELFQLAKSVNKQIFVYQNRRYSSDFLATKEVLRSGQLGDLIELNFRFDRYKSQIGPKKFKEEPFPASGILYDLGAHILDQVISLFGSPSAYTKTTGIYRRDSQVVDYGHLHLKYPNQVNVFVTVSMLTALSTPGIVIHGTKGSFIKPFSDQQEAQSIQGILPSDPNFGIENPEDVGILQLANGDGTFKKHTIRGVKGNMLGLFEDVFQSLRNNKNFPVLEDEILCQLEMLEHPDC